MIFAFWATLIVFPLISIPALAWIMALPFSRRQWFETPIYLAAWATVALGIITGAAFSGDGSLPILFYGGLATVGAIVAKLIIKYRQQQILGNVHG